MSQYKVTTEDGEYLVTTEDSPTDQAQPEKGMIAKGWDALTIPEKKSREGLKMLSDMVPSSEPTGNMAMDIAKNTPKVLAETLGETAPGFINRASLVTTGLLKGAQLATPAIKAVGGALGKFGEGVSGLEYKTPGVLTEAAKDPSLIFAEGKKAASPLYEAARAETGDANIFKGMYKPEEIIDKAKQVLSEGGTLQPSEALMYRKSIDKAMKSGRYLKDELMSLRNEADSIAKSSENIKMADPIYARGAKAEALRTPFATNKSGGTSIAKAIWGSLAGVAPVAAMSPVVQGSLATLLGLAARGGGQLARTPFAGSAIGALLNSRNRNSNAR